MSIEQIPTEQSRSITSSLNDFEVQNNSVELKNNSELISSENSVAKIVEKQTELQLEKKKLEEAELAKQEANPEKDKKEVEQSLEVINQLIPLKNTNLVFEFDDINDPPIVKVIDKNTDEVIREIPPQNIRKISQALHDMADSINKSGALFSTEV